MLTHFSLFSGIGGIDLSAEWAGFQTVGQCEFADYPTRVLEKHWPDVPRWRDIRTVTKESFYERTGLRTVDIISGGFPCQPFSVAGKQKGKRDDRYLWPEMLRVIREIKPTWVLGENVPGILSIAGKTVCEDLEREGYAVTVFNFEAAAVGAPHRRERVFFLANSSRIRRRGRDNEDVQGQDGALQTTGSGTDSKHGFLADTTPIHTQGQHNGQGKRQLGGSGRRSVESGLGMLVDGLSYWLDGYWRVEPNIPRVATGVKNRVDRLKCLGNAVVPQQVYPILAAIAEIERR